MFRLLLRSEEQVQSIAALDSAFNLMDDVHTNVIAGLAMDDGETIAAWLPEAEVEFGPPAVPARPPPSPRPPKSPVAPGFPGIGNSFFEDPDMTVIGPDGKRLAAKYIGLDAVTGLSILRLTNKNAVPAVVIKDEAGKHRRHGFAVWSGAGDERREHFCVVVSTLAWARLRVEYQNVMPAPSGGVARFKVSCTKTFASEHRWCRNQRSRRHDRDRRRA